MQERAVKGDTRTAVVEVAIDGGATTEQQWQRGADVLELTWMLAQPSTAIQQEVR